MSYETRTVEWRLPDAGYYFEVERNAGVRTAGIDLELFQTVVYKNAVASAVVFFMGGAFYYFRRRWGQPLPFVAIAISMLAWVAVVTIPALALGAGPERSAGVFWKERATDAPKAQAV